MSNFSPLYNFDTVEGLIIVERLFSCYKFVAHTASRGRRDYDLKARVKTLNAAVKRFESLREDVTFDVAIILWVTEEDSLVDEACRTLCEGVSYPAVLEYLRSSAHWEGNPSIDTFHERLTRFVQSITAQKTVGTDHARTV